MIGWMRIIVYALLVLFSLASCGKIEEPQFKRIDGFGLKKLGVRESVIGFNLVFQNPNNFGLTVKEADINVYVDSVLLGKFKQPNETMVEKNAEFSIPLEGAIGIDKALQLNLPSLLGKEVQVRGEGNVRVGKGGVFINKAVSYTGKHRIDANLIKNPASAGSQN